MPVNLSIKGVPDHVAQQLRRRAIKHHRSLQGELLAIIEESVGGEAVLMPAELLTKIRQMGLKTPEESAQIIRKDRDARSNR